MSTDFVAIIPDDATPAERDFLEALNRIMRGSATHADLIARASKGRFRPSAVTVALEARRDRKPIATGSLPRVASEIGRAQRHHGNSTQPNEAIRDVERTKKEQKLRAHLMAIAARNTELKRERDLAYTSDAGAMMLARALEKYLRCSDLDVQAMRRASETRLGDL